jgi:tRNA-modifying protein YgfZ
MMSNPRFVAFARRGVVSVGGADARKFLNDLVTAEIGRAADGRAVYSGLLTPQGKILFDFIIFADDGWFLFDLPLALVPDFVKRLSFYRLRAKVEIANLTGERKVVATWGDERPVVDGSVAADPRLAELGYRAIVAKGAADPSHHIMASETEYDAHRIGLGVPEGGIDFAFGEAFPHDADMDQLGGIDFDKGCYVGQEVVSRMQHRGTARRRIVMAQGTGLTAGTEITAGARPLGSLTSAADGHGLALVRLDRAKEAIDAAEPILAGEVPVTLALPGWARFTWPSAGADRESA